MLRRKKVNLTGEGEFYFFFGFRCLGVSKNERNDWIEEKNGRLWMERWKGKEE